MALAMVLLVLLLGSGLLHATRQQLDGALSLVADERQFLLEQHQALSALAWGAQLTWPPQQQGWHCQRQPQFGWRACVLHRDNGEALLRGGGESTAGEALALWQWLTPGEGGRWQPLAHGWLDFCPLSPSDCLADEG
ncbi:hypothetical protein COO59_13815 [Mixta theicola]|uniref:DUF2509 domain-containing protein n=1 Tax=Mixta theicola TaxID=1458355 RepID=A0A2K1Q7I6_9GAMM|nr:DUF2509 family protein [Mixta theicola]PNS11005.1 hypothetical protein COO59_13815 [Mixta theicola]GLR08348.1 hypothetical protein GCM10007905_10670 [Mixta theicola]